MFALLSWFGMNVCPHLILTLHKWSQVSDVEPLKLKIVYGQAHVSVKEFKFKFTVIQESMTMFYLIIDLKHALKFKIILHLRLRMYVN